MGKKIFLSMIISILLFFGLNSYIFPGQPSAKKLLFENDEILEVQIVGNIGKISKDRGKNKAYHPAKIIYLENNGDQIIVDVLLRTRGLFRLNPSKYLKIDDSTLYTLDSKQSSFLSVFQFMIGNTDWSYMGDHNVKRIIPISGGASLGVPLKNDC